MKIPKNQTEKQAAEWNAKNRAAMQAEIRQLLEGERDPVGILLQNLSDAQLRQFVLREGWTYFVTEEES